MAWKDVEEMQIARLEQENRLLKEKLALSEAKVCYECVHCVPSAPYIIKYLVNFSFNTIQAKTYEEDFQTERLDRERAQSRKLVAEEMCTRMQMVLDIGDPALHGHLRNQLVASGEHGIPVAAAPILQGVVRDEDLIRQRERKIGCLEEQVQGLFSTC